MKKSIPILVLFLALLGCSEDNKISKVLEKCADQKINFKYKKEVFNDFSYLQKKYGEANLYNGNIVFPKAWVLEINKNEIEKRKERGEDVRRAEFELKIDYNKLENFKKSVSGNGQVFLDDFNKATLDLDDFKKSLSRKLNESEEYLKLYKSCDNERSKSSITFDQKNK
jgi:hypothetical protein